MNKEEKLFNSITKKLVAEDVDISLRKMMSSPGIKFKNKVFAFYYDNEMTFILGKDFIPDSEGIKDYRFLNPFKNKPPLAGWFQISYAESEKWEKLARLALSKMRDE